MPSLSARRLSGGTLPRIKSIFKQPAASTLKQPVCTERCIVEALPMPVIRAIARQADSLSDVLNLSLCSRRMRALVLPCLYANVELVTNKQCKSTLVSLSKRLDTARHVRRLLVSPNRLEWTVPGEEIDEKLICDLVCTLAPHLRSLEYFAWDGWEAPPEDLWVTLRKCCPRLRGVSSVIGDQPLNPTSQLFKFSNLYQFSLSVKTRSLEWVKSGPAKVERLPRRLWEMLIERCPCLEELSLVAIAPAHRIFDARSVVFGRWPRLRSITLGDMMLQDGAKDDISSIEDYQAFMKFFMHHPRLEHVAFQHAGASTIFPSSFALPFNALPLVESFQGPLRYLRSLPHPENLRHLSLTSLHHTMSSFQPTFALLHELPYLESLDIWIDLSFSGQAYLQDESQLFSSFLSACPLLRDLKVMCFTRPTFRIRDFSRALRNAPSLESFTLIKMFKSSDEDMTTSAVRIQQENPNLDRFTLQYTLDRWPTQAPGRLKQMGTYRANYDEFGYPETLQAYEWKLKTFGSASTRRFVHDLSAKLPSVSPEARSPRSSISSDSRSWHRRSGSQSSFIIL